MKNILLAMGLFCLFPALSHSEGALETGPKPIWLDEGDVPIPFSVTCASTSWTTLVSSDTIRRSLLVQSVSDNSKNICISTITTTGYACADGTPGIELGGKDTWSDYTVISWKCRARQTVGSTDTRGVLKGIVYRDKGDYGRNR